MTTSPDAKTDDVRIAGYDSVLAPEELIREFPADDKIKKHVLTHRQQISDILQGKDQRLLVVVGPCSVHDVDAAKEYAQKLAGLAEELKQTLLIVMRIYFEKPRTVVGWKGLINDPDLDESFNINKGLKLARRLLLDVNQMGLAIGTEFLDLISPQFIADLVSWGAIGARTTESQGHRELASGLSCPVGFKNATSGDHSVAIDAVLASAEPHIFMSINKKGECSIVRTKGNENCHLILRGGKNKPNYDAVSVNKACEALSEKKLRGSIMVDCSHANSLKQHQRQKIVAKDVAEQIRNGDNRITGLMIESFLEEGNQSISQSPRQYGQSITDSCISWQDTETLLRETLAPAVAARKK